jgi:hypothetical protein
MRVNEKIITGMFKYHDDIVFTEDDFVISPNNFLYVVIQETQGRNPDLGYPEYYVPYNSEEKQSLATYEDFQNYITSAGNQGELGNKVLTLGLLSQILDSYLIGIDSSGKIRNKIFTDEIWFTDYLGNIAKTSCDSNPLDILMENPEINHGYFVIEDRIIFDNVGIVNESGQVPEEVMGILRQYTFNNEFGYTIRIQEVIEVITGNVLFRYAINTEGKEIFDKNKISTWRGYVDPRDGIIDTSKGYTDEDFAGSEALQNLHDRVGKVVENYTSSTATASMSI